MILYREMTEWHDHDHQPTTTRRVMIKANADDNHDISDLLITLTLKAWPEDQAMRQ